MKTERKIRGRFFGVSSLLVLSSLVAFSQRIAFDENWKFQLGHAGDVAKDFNYGGAAQFCKASSERKSAVDYSFNDSAWRTLDVPHDWAVELPFVYIKNFDVAQHGFKPVGALFPDTSIGWYRKHFTVSKNDSTKHFQLQFDGVYRHADFWLNGFYLGKNISGYLGTTFDVSDFLYFNKENVLVVRVDATQYEGWFYEGAGIYRHVWLNVSAPVHVANDGLFVYSEVKEKAATLFSEIEIENSSLQDETVSVQLMVSTRDGKNVAQSLEQSVAIPAKEKAFAKLSATLAQPILWSVENPYLYRAKIRVRKENKIIDEKAIRAGVRTISIKPDGVFVNEKHVKIKGTNNHQDHAGIGSALPDYMQYYRIQKLKEMGSNAYRCSHHAPTPELLDACDSLGMLVLDETRLLNSGAEYQAQWIRLLKRDRNHPSIFLWSIGNEEQDIQKTFFGKRIGLSMQAVLKKYDPTRTCTYAADLGNVFYGVNEIIPVRGFNYRESDVADYHRAHSTQPIIGTEMGSTVTTRGEYKIDSVKGYLPDKDTQAPWWASTAEKWWTLAGENNFWLGGFIWTGFDYRGEPTPFDWPNINSHFGVMDVCGFPKNLFYYYQSWWSDKEVIKIVPHWNWQGQENKPIDVWVFSNADNVELFLNKKSLGKKTMPRNGHLQWSVPYQAGVMEAVGIKNGKRISDKVETNSAPTVLKIQTEKSSVKADGKDVAVVNISITDKKGNELPTANNEIKFSIRGGKIIGVGNGDPSSHEADKCEEGKWKRNLFNGKCQVIIQADKVVGKMELIVASEGLPTQTISFNKQ